ncbi:hypothetical protein [Desulfovibrio sp. ZJ369]|uniref:hypothetical protein n=1 Tax=Desulfovibrio sp. ZJ369 TaxID=2709793 RepID=UPI0013ED7E4B|nr:hypothetical protein [Desulfovibrio sp. ZJ369]
MLPSSTKLTIFQRGIAQKCAVFCIYLISITVTAFILDWLDKKTFLKIVHEVNKQGSISEQAVNAFTILIESREGIFFLDLILIGVICGVVGLLIIQQFAKLQWSKAVVLPKVIEFKQAMQHIGIHTPGDRIDFVRKQGVPVFIASEPFLELEQYNVPVRLYAFAYDSNLSDANIFNSYIGQQRLCLDAADYEYLLEKYGQKALSAYAARIRDLEETITNLQGAFSVQQTKMNELTEQNQALLAEKVEYQNKEKTLSGREKSLESRENVKLPVRRIFYPLVNRLIAEARPGTKYTRTKIQEEFLRELDSFPELKSAVRDALHTPQKAKNNTPFELAGWAMEEIRLALGEYAQTSPGRDRES